MRRFCELLRDVMKICSMHQDRPFVWKVHWKHLAWTHKLEWEGYQGITRARRPVLSKLMEVQTWWLLELPARWGKAQQKNRALRQHFFLGENAPPTFTQMRDDPVPSHMFLAPFRLLSQCWSSCKPLKRNVNTPAALHFTYP